MSRSAGFFLLLLINCLQTNAQWSHPLSFADQNEFLQIKKSVNKTPVLQSSFQKIKSEVDVYLNKDIDVPVPKDPAGGYTHDQHKNNYLLLYNAGLLYQITGDARYAELAKTIFIKYAALNPTLKNHPQATSSSPGRLFWQALNDANWLVYAGLSFDCIHDYLTPSDRKTIADGAFKPLVDYFTHDQKKWFDLIHNHAVWACAGVGIVGIATDNNDYLQMALLGSDKKGKAGFLAHLDQLFSPDGFYHEGPYYTRYAILPFYLFANAIEHADPKRKIFQYRNQILKKALNVALQQTNLDGSFFSYNDALKDKTYLSNEIVNALDLAWQYYGSNVSWLAVAQRQNRVILTKGGLALSEKIQELKGKKLDYQYETAEYKDGAACELGGLSVLRSGKGDQLTSLIFKYTGHGLSHGHFDKLNIQLFDKGNEILQDYGAVRYINIEQKWGGRYLKETNTYAQQTIAHNTVTVDEASHYKGDEKISQQNHPTQIFSDLSHSGCLVTIAQDDKAYPGVQMSRTCVLLTDSASGKKWIFDWFNVASDSSHQYDLPYNYQGTLIQTNFPYQTYTHEMKTLGDKNGYQHLWLQAYAQPKTPIAQLTFLNHQTFYTISTFSSNPLVTYFTQTGANDPDFNLRREPSYILRSKGKQQTYFSVIDIHGDFSPVTEIAHQSYSEIQSIRNIVDNEDYQGFEIIGKNNHFLFIQCKKDFDANKSHTTTIEGKSYEWKGAVLVHVK